MTDVQLQVDSSMTLREKKETMNMEGGYNEFDFIEFNNDY